MTFSTFVFGRLPNSVVVFNYTAVLGNVFWMHLLYYDNIDVMFLDLNILVYIGAA